MIGKHLAHYEVTAELGAGGMGKVYRARDTRLGREVALKVLPEEFAKDADRLSRFEREAKLLATLNHPNVAAIHGLEQAEGERFLVLELATGEDLAKRIERGPVPVAEAIDIARQVAEALETAHDTGIIHRDLKPANIVVDAEGKVKVLDFGLAKALEGDAGASADLSHSPTIMASSPTVAGVILGTAAYMSPEQARGKPVDRRADIFAFGCVLSEMLTGRQTFAGETVSDILASVLKTDPDFDELPDATPYALRRLIERCLEKNARRRLRDIGEARILLEDLAAGRADMSPHKMRGDGGRGAADGSDAVAPGSRIRGYLGWIAAGAMAIVVAGMFLRGPQTPQENVAATPRDVIRFAIDTPAENIFRFTVSDGSSFAPPVISPNGRQVVFGARSATDAAVLWLRDLGQAEPRRVQHADDGHLPFWSPDSRRIGFFSRGKLRTISTAGGPSAVVCDVTLEARGGAWSERGTILFSPGSNSPLYAVPEAGGTPTAVTAIDSTVADVSHRWPVFLPDGERFLYTVWTNNAEAQARVGGIFLGSMDGAAPQRILVEASSVTYVPDVSDQLATYEDEAGNAGTVTGYLLFTREQTLMTVPFDAVRGKAVGAAVAIVEGIQYDALTGRTVVAASRTGTVLYRAGTTTTTLSTLEWLDRDGQTLGTIGESYNYWEFRVSPDSKRVVVSVVNDDGSTDLAIVETERNLLSRFTFDTASDWDAVWSPDQRIIGFTSDEAGVENIFVKPADGSVDRRVLVQSEDQKSLCDWSPDGRYLLFEVAPTSGRRDNKSEVWLYEIESGTSERLLFGSYNYHGQMFSPDGKWILYLSDESGRMEVYVRSITGVGGRWQISNAGGTRACWRADGKEIVYASPAHELMSVPVDIVDGVVTAGAPTKLFDLPAIRDWDIAPDHRRILIARVLHDRSSTPLTVVVNWPQEVGGRRTLR